MSERQPMLKVLDLFSGIGGFSLGLANATNSHQTRAMKSLHTSKQQEVDDAPNH